MMKKSAILICCCILSVSAWGQKRQRSVVQPGGLTRGAATFDDYKPLSRNAARAQGKAKALAASTPQAPGVLQIDVNDTNHPAWFVTTELVPKGSTFIAYIAPDGNNFLKLGPLTATEDILPGKSFSLPSISDFGLFWPSGVTTYDVVVNVNGQNTHCAADFTVGGSRNWFRDTVNQRANNIITSLNFSLLWTPVDPWFQWNSTLSVNWLAGERFSVGGSRTLTAYIQPNFRWAQTGLTLTPLDRWLFGDWLRESRDLTLIGASIGAWRMAAAADADPVGAIAELERGYIELPRRQGCQRQRVQIGAVAAAVGQRYGAGRGTARDRQAGALGQSAGGGVQAGADLLAEGGALRLLGHRHVHGDAVGHLAVDPVDPARRGGTRRQQPHRQHDPPQPAGHGTAPARG